MVGSFIVIKMALQLDLACFYVDGESEEKRPQIAFKWLE